MISAKIEMRQQGQAGRLVAAATRLPLSERIQPCDGCYALSREGFIRARQGIAHDRHCCCILPQLSRIDLVESVGGCVVIVEVGATVLHEAERRGAFSRHARYIRARRKWCELDEIGSEALQDLLYGTQELDRLLVHLRVKSQ